MNASEFARIPVANTRSKGNSRQDEREKREECGRLYDRAEAIVAQAKAADRDLTADETNRVESLMAQAKVLSNQISNFPLAAQTGDGGDLNRSGWVDAKTGKPVYVLGKADRWQDLPRENNIDPSARVGEFIKCAITGNWRNASPAIRNAMSEGGNSAGGFLVPDELMRRVIDLARAKSVVMQAGAQTIPMTSDSLTLARVATDPTFEVKTENAAFSGSDIAFDALNFSAYTVGTLITASRELAEDAPNFVDLVESVLASAFAAKLDNIAINGVASSGLDGMLDWATATGIGETGTVGGILWEDLQTAVVGIHGANHVPNAYVLHPTIAGDLAALTSGDGTNSAKLWLGPPPNVAPLTQMQTTNIATDSIVVGDFSQFVWAIRQGVLIEVSREAGDAFAKHQVLIKLTWRGDTGAFRRDAFHRLVGITT